MRPRFGSVGEFARSQSSASRAVDHFEFVIAIRARAQAGTIDEPSSFRARNAVGVSGHSATILQRIWFAVSLSPIASAAVTALHAISAISTGIRPTMTAASSAAMAVEATRTLSRASMYLLFSALRTRRRPASVAVFVGPDAASWSSCQASLDWPNANRWLAIRTRNTSGWAGFATYKASRYAVTQSGRLDGPSNSSDRARRHLAVYCCGCSGYASIHSSRISSACPGLPSARSVSADPRVANARVSRSRVLIAKP
ncbi:MAG: hypothetical protein EB020_05960 [Proteobacteria bacterium]|nr:hypothetical protein [Pseudomonadota bacterium]